MNKDGNLFELLRHNFPADLGRPFITDGTRGTYSYAAMIDLSGRVANYLENCGLKQGDRVAVQVQKSPEALMIYLACIRAGLIYIPLNTAYQLPELQYFFDDSRPSLIIGDPKNAKVMQQLAETVGSQFTTMSADGRGSLMDSADLCSPDYNSTLCADSDLAAILYTSGTTGRPKGAMLSHKNLSSNALVLKQIWGWSDEDVLLHALPIFHVHGLFVACHCVLAAGASMIFLPAFNAKDVIGNLSAATVMMGVPTFYTRLLAEQAFGASHCENMRLFISGSAPLLEDTHQQFEQRTGHTILERYGMSETSMQTSNPLKGERRAGTVGFALPGIDVRIVDRNNHPVTGDNIGSIQVKGPNVFQGYWKMPEKTAEEFTPDGYFITGDQGKISADGYISIVGRAKDMVISGGYNVYPKEVELVIDSLKGIAECAVFGIADSDFGEAVVVAIVPDGDDGQVLDVESIIDETKLQLASYKVPKKVHFVEELPRNTMGKVQKNILREQFAKP
ncbi:MAG: malonyl-CoA synthase [Oceanicoccus sp.]